MKILITGGTGFIGQNLIPLIIEQRSNIELLLLCRKPQAAIEKYHLNEYPFVRVVEASDWNAVIMFNPEVVLHLAAFSTSLNDSEALSKLIDSNITYGVNLLHALSQCNQLKLFVNTGSFAEYRKGPRKIDNAYLYSATKSAFRAFLDYYAKLTNFKYITAVPYSVYGGVPTVKRIMDYMMDSIGSSSPVNMTAGEQILDFIHVDDVAKFYVATCLQTERFLQLEQGQEFHLGTGRGYTLREVAKELEQITGETLNIYWGGRPYRDRDTMYAIAPISSNGDLWKSSINLHEGLKRFVETGYKKSQQL